jgi:hypothetical protein
MLSRLAHPYKPWVIPAARWKESGLALSDVISKLLEESPLAVAVAKPSENIYLGFPVFSATTVTAAITNLASHGEMAIDRIDTSAGSSLSVSDAGLVDLLPTQIMYNGAKIGQKNGRFLNHFGYRKIVMNFQPETLKDHAWVANALSYSSRSDMFGSTDLFDPKGGFVAGGVAGITNSGAIFRGSAILGDTINLSAKYSMHVSALANGVDVSEIVDVSVCDNQDSFRNHRFFKKLRDIVTRE